MLLLDAGLRVLGQTPQTHGYLARLLPPSGTVDPVPAAAYNVAAQLIAVEEGVDARPPLARVHLAGGRWLTLRAARLGGAVGADARIAVTVEEASPGERTAVFARACGLAARETELLHHLATGADSRTLAARMFLSVNTRSGPLEVNLRQNRHPQPQNPAVPRPRHRMRPGRGSQLATARSRCSGRPRRVTGSGR
jgi:hypothetical protein